ncbi:polysaccharide biosynthesis/export family protein [uncultured Gimesia sp.]|uniref:polysaccharide biosynthesis/export family protein n=1 Tax=uncultured Gimesia sp. TaxID=1678688 RepID=UPI0026202470|nr:polysaccharide biosynthesis/export family protein [uncultured Gimesia sp.]
MMQQFKNMIIELKGSIRMQKPSLSMPESMWHILCALFLTVILNGCAAIHPIKGVPAQYIPSEYKAEVRSGKETIDLSLLRQPAPTHYLLDSGDVLGVYIEGVLGQFREVPPVHFPQTQEVAPSLGYPIPIREDGTISLPLIGNVFARGLTLNQLEETIRSKYTTEKGILKVGRDRILISLQRPRSYRILVIRQENANDVVGGGGGVLNIGRSKRGTGRVVNLPAYSNDVLHALAETGGLPGLDAENSIYIIRGAAHKLNHSICPQPVHTGSTSSRNSNSPQKIRQVSDSYTPIPNSNGGQIDPSFQVGQPLYSSDGGTFYGDAMTPTINNDSTMQRSGIIKIPIRLSPGEQVHLTPQEIILHDGDVVFIESRDTEIFYTGGLLGGGQYTLPRDYDLDILGAISIAQAAGTGGGGKSTGGPSALNQDVTISASNAIILRQLPNGTQLPIKVDLYEAVRHPSQRVLIQPGDYVILQYTKSEAIGAFIERHLLEGALFGLAASNLQSGGGNN